VFTPVASLHWLAPGGVELAAKVLRRRIHQPVGVHQAQVPHVAAGRVQQLVEDHVGRLGLEQDGGRVDGHGLVGVQGQVAAIGLQLGCIDEQPMGKAATGAPRVRPARLQLHVELADQRAERDALAHNNDSLEFNPPQHLVINSVVRNMEV